MTCEIKTNSMKNRGCVVDAFLERVGAALGCQMLDSGSQNIKKSSKWLPNSIKNQRTIEVMFLDHFGMALGRLGGVESNIF